MKNVIQRMLPLNVKYTTEGITYISVLDGGGCCDNCGRTISNIAHVKSSEGKHYSIGTDCLETIIINNSLLDSESYMQYMYSDLPALQKAKSLRSKIISQRKKNTTFKAVLYKCENGTNFGFSFSVYNEHRGFEEPMGWDYTFNIKYFDLTINYVKDLLTAPASV